MYFVVNRSRIDLDFSSMFACSVVTDNCIVSNFIIHQRNSSSRHYRNFLSAESSPRILIKYCYSYWIIRVLWLSTVFCFVFVLIKHTGARFGWFVAHCSFRRAGFFAKRCCLVVHCIVFHTEITNTNAIEKVVTLHATTLIRTRPSIELSNLK